MKSRRSSPSQTSDDPLPDPLHQQLLRRIRKRFAVVTQEVRIGPLTFDFTRVTDPDVVLDEVAAEEDRLEKLTGRRTDGDHLHLPYWAELWDSAMGIGQFLVQTRSEAKMEDGEWKMEEIDRRPDPLLPSSILHPPSSILASVSVLDLGCGMGLSGTVAALLGHRVLFADLEAAALLFARLNSLPARDRVRTRRLNWQTDSLDETFDLIIGADILYERKQWDHLEPFWKKHVSPGGSVLLGEPGRQTGDLFLEWIGDKGWRLEKFEQQVVTRPKPVRVLKLSRVDS